MAAARKGRAAKRRKKREEEATPTPSESWLGSLAPYAPLALTIGLLALSVTPRVSANGRMALAFWGAAAFLLAWQTLLFARLRPGGTPRRFDVALRPQHYVQASVQLAVFLYWGWFWRPVYGMAIPIASQLVFAYAFDMLLSWSRGERYRLGFGPFPIIFSVNLFLWFKDDWFALQFLMIGIGFLGKELVRWHREGRSVHIFNPSAFALGLFSLVLIATNTTDLTWGPEIASTLTLAPWIYAYLFGLGLVVMYFFSITLVAGLAAATLFGLSALYSSATGVPYFLDSEIPAAVFLGLHLLITDPSTSPRTSTGKALFGIGYGVGVFALYSILGAFGAPTFYDKLLCVPLLNLSVRGLDAVAERIQAGGLLDRLRTAWSPRALNLAHMAAWVVFFGVMSATGRADGRHVGDALPFWEQACAEERANACERLLSLEATYCGDASAWACNELGVHYAEGRIVEADPDLSAGYLGRACELRFQAGCVNLLSGPGGLVRAPPKPLDLRLLLREGGLNLMELPEAELSARACDHGWSFACSARGAE